jgi:hypothetical protein
MIFQFIFLKKASLLLLNNSLGAEGEGRGSWRLAKINHAAN